MYYISIYSYSTKENLKDIIKEGIKPGMKGGWCDLWSKKLEEEIPNYINLYRKECQKNIFLSPSFHGIEEEMPKEDGICK